MGLLCPPVQIMSNAFQVSDGRLIVSGASSTSSNGPLVVFNATTLTEYPLVPSDQTATEFHNITGIAYSNDFSLLAVAYDASPYVLIYDTSDGGNSFVVVGALGTTPSGAVQDLAFSPDGSMLAVVHNTSPYLELYRTSDWAQISGPATPPTGAAYGVAFSPDGTYLAVAHTTSPRVTMYTVSGLVKRTNPLQLPASNAWCVAFSPDSSTLAVGHNNSPYVTLYEVSTFLKISNPASLPTTAVVAAQFSPDGALLALVNSSEPLKVYQTSGWADETGFTQPTGQGLALAWSVDGKRLAVGHVKGANPRGITVYEYPGWASTLSVDNAPVGDSSVVVFNNRGI